jgi:hypothetical protein
MPQIANTYYGFDVVKISLSKIFWQFKPLDVRVDFYCDKDIKDIRVVEASVIIDKIIVDNCVKPNFEFSDCDFNFSLLSLRVELAQSRKIKWKSWVKTWAAKCR